MTEPTIVYYLNKLIQKTSGGILMGIPYKELEIADYSDLGGELVVAGDFSTTTGWTWSGVGTYAIDFTVSSNRGTMTETAGSVQYGRIYQAVSTKVGRRYVAAATFKGTLSSNLSSTYPTLRIGTTAGGIEVGTAPAATFTEDQTITIDFIATATTTYLTLIHRSDATNVGVSVWETCTMKEVIGGDLTVRGTTYQTGDSYLGGYTNAVKVAKDGEITLTGTATRFLDERGYLPGSRLYSPSSKIVWDDAECAFYFKDTATTSDYISCPVQFNHDRKHGAVLMPHLHWEQRSASIPNWMIQYRYQRQGAAKVTAWTSAKYASHAFTYSSGTLDQITLFPAITPTSGDGVSDILQIRIIRDYNNTSTLFAGNDPQAGDVYVTDFDVHKEIDSMGSATEYVK